MDGRRRRWLVAATLAVVLVAGLVALGPLGGASGAQSADERGWFGRWGHEGHRGPDPERVVAFRARLAADLGEELDVPAGDVEAAFRTLVSRRLTEAVADGRIDREHADKALTAYDEGRVKEVVRALVDSGD